jgi:hypothetical protein
MDQEGRVPGGSGFGPAVAPVTADPPLAVLFSAWFREAQVCARLAGKARSTASQEPTYPREATAASAGRHEASWGPTPR